MNVSGVWQVGQTRGQAKDPDLATLTGAETQGTSNRYLEPGATE